jgi:hypothetical protein
MKFLMDTLTNNSTTLHSLHLRSNSLITDLSIDSIVQMVEHNQTLSIYRLDLLLFFIFFLITKKKNFINISVISFPQA